MELNDYIINTSKSKTLQVGRLEEDVHVHCNRKESEVVADFTYLGTVLERSRKVDFGISNIMQNKNLFQIYR